MGAGSYWGTLNAVLTDALQHNERAERVIGRAFAQHTDDGAVRLGPEAKRIRRPDVPGGAAGDEVVVTASGNLGLIYFPAWPGRMSLEQIDAAFPALIPTLA